MAGNDFGITVQLTGRGFGKYSVRNAIVIWETEIAPIVMSEIRRRAPVGNDPGAGRLRDSISVQRVRGGGGIQLRFTSSAPYAGYVENGTVPHRIEPRTALALHWQTNGADVFARYVNHPGTKANPFVKRAIEATKPLMQKMLREAVERELRK